MYGFELKLKEGRRMKIIVSDPYSLNPDPDPEEPIIWIQSVSQHYLE